MRFIPAAVVALSLLAPVTAMAGTYVGLAIGPRPTLDSNTLEESGRTARIAVGYRLTRFSIEGAITANGGDVNPRLYTSDYSARHLTLAGKYSHPLGNGFELFGKAGLQWSKYTVDQNLGSFDGHGLMLAGGVEWRLNLGIAAASLFAEYNVSSVTVAENGADKDLQNRQWLLGVSLGM